MGEPGLAEGHETGVEVAPDEEKKKGHGSIILTTDGVDHREGEIESKQNFRVGNPTGLIAIRLLDESVLFVFDLEFGRANELTFHAQEGFENGLGVADRDADAGGHDERHKEEGAPPGARAKDALRDEIEARDGAGGGEKQREIEEQHLKPALVGADDHRREKHGRKQNHEGIADVSGEVEEGFGLDVPGRVGAENFRQDFLSSLHEALGPAGLLRLEAVDVHGELGSALDLGKIEESPAAKLGAVGQIGVLGEGVVLPAAGVVNRGTAPDAGGTVEIEESAAAGAGAVLDDEMTVEKDGFDVGEEGVVGVEVGPAGLDHGDFFSAIRIEEIRDGAAEEIGGREKIGVEDGHEFAAGGAEAVFEGASLEAFAVGAMDAGDGHARGGVAVDASAGDVAGFIGGVIEDLNVEKFAGIVEAGDGFDEALDDVALVEDGKLYGNLGPVL